MFDIEKIYRKPLLDPNTTLNFDRFGFWINVHPIIIFEYGNDVVFLTAQSAKFSDFSKTKLLDPKLQNKLDKNEMFLINSTKGLIPKNSRGLFYNDSLVDTTSLFVMNKDDFAKVFNLKNNNYLEYTRKIDAHSYYDLLSNVQNNIENDKYTINKVVVENNIAKCDLLWTNKELYISDYKTLTIDKKSKVNLDFINEFPNEYTSKNLLLSLIEDELNLCCGLFEEFRNNTEPYTYTAYSINDDINTNALFGLDENECSDADYQILLEIECFSDFEKEYYKQNPKEFDEKYWTYLDELKTQYNEWKQEQTKQQDKGFEM